MPQQSADEMYMARALELAASGRALVRPNPMVGAVVVRDGAVVGEGYHRQFGGPHAEIFALEQAGEAARGATVYINLEPCSQFGKTPPCTAALIEAGVARVVFGVPDPHQQPDGAQILLSHGIATESGVLRAQAIALNKGFLYRQIYGRPYIIAKAAQTADGYVQRSLANPGWFTSAESRREVHRLRAQVDAVLVGHRTIEHDNPGLTVRDAEGRNPVRVVLDPTHVLKDDYHVFNDGAVKTILVCVHKPVHTIPAVDYITVGEKNGLMDLSGLLIALAGAGINSLLIEGGPQTHKHFAAANLINEIVLFTAVERCAADVRGRADLKNTLSISGDWTVLEDREIGGDHFVRAHRGWEWAETKP